jgi:hypothetical protein
MPKLLLKISIFFVMKTCVQIKMTCQGAVLVPVVNGHGSWDWGVTLPALVLVIHT